MNDATWAMLNETEKALLREAEPRAAGKLDEDALLDLHARTAVKAQVATMRESLNELRAVTASGG